MDGITFRYLISMAVNLDLKMKLKDVVTAYIYGNMDSKFTQRSQDGLCIISVYVDDLNIIGTPEILRKRVPT